MSSFIVPEMVNVVEELEDSKIFKPGLDGDQVTVYPVAPPESSNSIASISP